MSKPRVEADGLCRDVCISRPQVAHPYRPGLAALVHQPELIVVLTFRVLIIAESPFMAAMTKPRASGKCM